MDKTPSVLSFNSRSHVSATTSGPLGQWSAGQLVSRLVGAPAGHKVNGSLASNSDTTGGSSELSGLGFLQ